MAEYGNREIGIIQDALKEIYDELINGGASEFRQQILNTLLQGRPDKYYTTHVNTLFEAYEPLEATVGDLNLSTMMNYAFANLDVLVEMGAVDDLIEPAQMWTGYDETSEAVLDIANELNESFDFEIDTNQDIYDVLRETTEQLESSGIKVKDVPGTLELQIRVLDDMKNFEIGSMYSAWSSTEVMRPFTVQLVEVYNQIENLPEELIDELYVDIADNLSLKEGPSDYLRAYDNPNNSQAKAVKNVIKYYLEQLGRQQTGYVNFSSVDNSLLDGGRMIDFYAATDQVAADVGYAIKSNINLFLQDALEPTQLLNSVKSFQGVTADDFPFQIDKGYMQAYNDIIGTQIINNRAIKDVNSTLEYINQYNLSIEDIAEELNIETKSTPTNVVDDVNKIGTLDYPNQWHNTPTVKLVEAIAENNLDIYVKNSKGEFVKLELDDTARIGDNAIQNSPKFEEGKSAIYNAIEELGDVDNPRYKLDLYSSNPNELAKLENALSNVNFDPFVNPEGTPFQLLPDTPTNVVDLDEVISQSDGVDNLNKSKEIMQKNPGMFRKVFNVLEKLDIGDQVITKAVAKGLPAIGLGAMAPGVAIAYGAYEMSILLTDAAQAYNKMQTTDEGFWENFGELSDKYSIAYKISKPVYDIILDSLNEDLTEEKDEEILFSFNR